MRDDRTIPLQPLAPAPRLPRVHPLPPADAGGVAGPAAPQDRLQRPLRDLRISVTDRCNFRCGYCMPRERFGPGHRFLPQPALLSFEEIERAAHLLVGLGVHKIRLTGGEPLMRKELSRLIERLAVLRTPQGAPVALTLTTNASLLSAQARTLRDAGLQRVTVSLDALDDAVFRRMSDAAVPVRQVLDGIGMAQAVGLGPIKVNMVVQRGVNEDQILPMARHFRHTGVSLRFIEFMDVGATNGWRPESVVASETLRARIHEAHPLTPLPPAHPGETARRFAYADGGGEIGFISSVTQAFCGDCNRLRLSTDGRLYTCLFASEGHDLRAALRGGDDDATIQARLRALWQQRGDRYSQLRAAQASRADAVVERIEMSYIGG